MKRILFFIALFMSSATRAVDLTAAQVKILADHDEASLTPAQMQALTAAQGVAGSQAFGACTPPASQAELIPFTVVMKLDATGKIVYTWLEGTSDIAKCFNAAIGTKSLNKPPYAPFYTSFVMSWDPPPEPSGPPQQSSAEQPQQKPQQQSPQEPQ